MQIGNSQIEIVVNIVGKKQDNMFITDETNNSIYQAIDMYNRVYKDFGNRIWCYTPVEAYACVINPDVHLD
jgi:hypothetical protein